MKKIQLFLLSILLVTFHERSFAQCSTSSTPFNDCYYGDAIDAFTLNSIANTGSNNSCGTGYISFSTPVYSLNIGQSYSFSATVGGTWGYNQGFAIWIDLNNNSQYESSEMLYTAPSASTSHSSSITIPSSATAGNNIRMRVRCAYNYVISGNEACASYIGDYGETEDYFVNLIAPCPTPTITTQPQNRLTCEGNTATFSLAATSAASYQWQVNAGSGWSNVSGTVYSGGTTNSLTISGMTTTYNGFQYRCVVTGNCSNSITSNAVTLTVNPGAAIVSHTPDRTICEGAVTSLDVNAVGTISRDRKSVV